MSVTAFAADPQCVKTLVGGGGVGIGTTPGVGRPRVGMNLTSSLPHTSAEAVPVVGGGDIRVVGNEDVVKDVNGD